MGKREGLIQKEILKYLERTYPGALILRYNNTPIYSPRQKTFRSQHGKYIPYGVSDVFFFYQGKTVAIEIKTEEKYFYLQRNWLKLKEGEFVRHNHKGPLTERERFYYQIKFISDMEKNGHHGFFTYSIDNTEQNLKLILR